MPVEIVTGVLAALLAVVTVLAAYVGILGLTGTAVLRRCPGCNHLALRETSGGSSDCGYCRHERLLHPLWTARHSGTSHWATHRL